MRLQGTLAPGQSPLSSFVFHPKFVDARRNVNFRAWVDHNMTQFGKFGNEKGMYPLSHIVSIMVNATMILFRCGQIKNLISINRHQHKIFHPLTNFELFLADAGYTKKKVLTNLYKILLSANLVMDKVKVYWERELNVELSEAQCNKIKKM